MQIDTHHHLWRYRAEEYDWISEEMQVLRQDFLLEDLNACLASAAVTGTVAVQAKETLEETEWLLALAEEPKSAILGVVGWLPFLSPHMKQIVDRSRQNPLLRGARFITQGRPAGFMDSKAFNEGIASLGGTDLVYDILIYRNQIDEATRLLDRHPNQRFVLDHIGKPGIRDGEFARWKDSIVKMAQRQNVFCKISGMVTEADWKGWTNGQLKRYFDTALESFGPDRLMVGSDWPVLTLGASYSQWWNTVRGWLSELSSTEQEEILGGNAIKVYGLDTSRLVKEQTGETA